MVRMDFNCSRCGKLVIDSEEQTDIDEQKLYEELKKEGISEKDFIIFHQELILHNLRHNSKVINYKGIKVVTASVRYCYPCVLALYKEAHHIS